MWIAAILFIGILALLLYLDTRKPKNFPPGPKWLPIVGSSLAIHKIRQKEGYLYKATAKMVEKYGPVLGLRVGKDKVVMAYSFEAIREMSTVEDFHGRPKGPFYETRTWGLRRGLILTDEELWIEQRRFVLRQLREFGFGKKSMAHLVEDETAHLVKNVNEQVEASCGEGAIIEINELFNVYVLNTLWSMMAGIRYNPQDKELKTLQGLLSELFANIDMVGALFSQFPILRFLAPEFSGYKLFLDIHQRIWHFLRKELDKHKETYNPDEIRDFMDVYLKTLESDECKSWTFSESQLLAICMDLFMAGSETTAKTLSFGVMYLLLYPEVQKKAQEEIDRVIGTDRMPLLSDRANLPYMECVVLESIRTFMFRALSVPHRALRDTTLQGYFIPKDTMVIANMHGVLTNYQWKDGFDFRPDRFLKEGKVTIPDCYMPFGFGKHRCLGESLAKANIFLFLTSLLQKFDFSVVPGSAPPSRDGIDGVTPGPAPFKALITPRA